MFIIRKIRKHNWLRSITIFLQTHYKIKQIFVLNSFCGWTQMLKVKTIDFVWLKWVMSLAWKLKANKATYRPSPVSEWTLYSYTYWEHSYFTHCKLWLNLLYIDCNFMHWSDQGHACKFSLKPKKPTLYC